MLSNGSSAWPKSGLRWGRVSDEWRCGRLGPAFDSVATLAHDHSNTLDVLVGGFVLVPLWGASAASERVNRSRWLRNLDSFRPSNQSFISMDSSGSKLK